MPRIPSSAPLAVTALFALLAACREEPLELPLPDAGSLGDAQALPDALAPDASPNPDASLPDAEAAPDVLPSPDAGAPDAPAPDAFEPDATALPDAALTLEIAPLALPAAVIGAPYSVELSVSGGSGAGHSWSLVQGALPAGLALALPGTSTLTLSGTVTDAVGHYGFTVRVTDDAMNSGIRAYDIAVRDPRPELVAFTGDLEIDGQEGAYLADITPSAPTWARIHPVLSASVAAAPRIDLSPDGAWVAFIADYDQPPATDLYLAPVVAGQPGAALRVSPAGSNVADLAWSYDASRLAYSTTTGAGGPGQVFVLDTSGPMPSAPQELAGLPGLAADRLRFSPAANVLVIHQAAELYAADVTTLPATAVPLSGGFGGVELLPLPFSPDGLRLIFDEARAASGGQEYQYFAADFSGGVENAPIIPLTPPLFASNPAPSMQVQVSPDGARLAYAATVDRPMHQDLYLVEGVLSMPSAPRRISTWVGPGDDVLAGVRWSPSSTHLNYRVSDATGWHAYVDEVASGGVPMPQQLDVTTPGTINVVAETGFSSNGQLIWYKMLGATQHLDLYVRPFTNGTLGAESLLRPLDLPADASIAHVFFSPDSRALLVSHLNPTEVWWVHTYEISGAAIGPARAVPMPPLAGVRLGNCFWSRDPRRALLSFVTFNPFTFGLYAADLASPAVLTLPLGPTPVPGGSAKAFDLEAFGN